MKTLTRTQQTVLLAVVSGIASGLLFNVERLFAPGAVFGLLFGLINLDKKLLAIPYAIVSSVIYFIAYNIAVAFLFYFGSLLAGAFGAIALALVTQSFKRMRIDMHSVTRTLLIGMVAGAVFYPLTYGNSIAIYLGFTIWQAAVAWSLTTSIQNRSTPA